MAYWRVVTNCLYIIEYFVKEYVKFINDEFSETGKSYHVYMNQIGLKLSVDEIEIAYPPCNDIVG